jgi:hypothetical protein
MVPYSLLEPMAGHRRRLRPAGAIRAQDGRSRMIRRGPNCRPVTPVLARVVLLMGLMGLLAATPAAAGTGGVHRLPLDPRDAVHGVRLELDTRWVNGNGYRPVRVRVTTEPAVPSPRERRFQVTLEPMVPGINVSRDSSLSFSRASVSRWSAVRVHGSVVLAEGAGAGETTLLVPQSAFWVGIRVAVDEEGRRLAECSAEAGVPLELPREEWTEVIPAVLLVTRHMPRWDERPPGTTSRLGDDSSPQPSQLPQVALLDLLAWSVFSPSGLRGGGSYGPDRLSQLGSTASDAQIRELAGQMDKLEMLAPEDVPSRWIELSCFDLVFMDLADARLLAADHPAKWNAVRAWVEAGHSLIVFGVGESPAGLAELEGLLDLENIPPTPRLGVEGEPRVESMARYLRWQPLDLSNGNWDVSKVLSGSVLGFGGAMPLGDVGVRGIRLPTESPALVQRHRVGLGRVFAVTRPDPFQPPSQLGQIMNGVEGNHWSWMARHGLSLRRDNPDARSLRVTGVGEPPRVTYLVLITLFALAIGPLNYWALWRCRRLHLLLLTVPLAALGVTVLLMGYVVLRDGFQVRVEARSFTHLDQRRGRAACWSTQSYFASLPPADGLRFSDQTLVYPLNVENRPPSVMTGTRPASLEVNWFAGQNLQGGYLRPRELQHFVVVSSGSQPARLQLEPDGSSWRATNELGGTIRYLLVHGASGEYFRGEQLADGASVRLEERGLVDARGRILQLFQEHDILTSAGARNPFVRYQTIDSPAAEPRLNMGLMETWLSRIRTEPELVLPPRSYLAMVDWPAWLETGVPNPRRARNLHVVIGYW